MALLQISEPGDSPAPHQRRLAVGIDLGTTHSLVAAVRSGSPEALRDETGAALLPSAVRYLADGGVVVGQTALAQQCADPLNTLVSIKRFMGRDRQDVTAEQAAYELVDDSGMVRIRTVQGDVSPVEASARILAALRERAETALGDELVGAVITVPAYFDDAQRQATRDAARLAGINVLRLLNEPTAAAVAYGLDQGVEGVVAVYDLGGGTFDISILRLSRGVFEVAATAGDTALGGDDFDLALAEHALAEAGRDLAGLDRVARRMLLTAARRAREALTDAPSATLAVDAPDLSLSVTVSRETFEVLAQPLIDRTLACVRRTLHDAGLSAGEIKGVVMVGGATRMPVVRRAVGEMFGTEPLTNLDPDQVVALGAARQAHLLAGNRSADDDWMLLDVLPLSLGLETLGGLVERIIARNSTIPVARAQTFTTFKDGQTAMSLHVVQGERELASDCRSLARFELHGIPPMVAGAARIQVTFQVDADGLLNVSAREQTCGVEAAVTVKPSYGLSDDEVARMLAVGIGQADADARVRMLREQQVEAQRLVESVRAALAVDGDMLDAAARTQIDAALHAAEAAGQHDDVERVRAAVQNLSAATDDFAARRMDRSIRAALAGRKVTDLGN